jgi:hypothetical protein
MDSLTQITLGAAIGEAVAGKKAGYKAAAWGAFLGTFPDLDVIANPFLDSVNQLYFHRGITHGILFCALAPFVFGWVINKTHSKADISWRVWAKLSFWVFFTHIKSHVNAVFDSSFKHQHGYYQEMKTTPNGPSTFLWNAYIIKNDTLYQSVYSIFDENKKPVFRAIPVNSHLINMYKSDRGVEALLWFSRGYYTVQKENGKLVFYDLRFGRSDFWLSGSENVPYVWRNEILIDEQNGAYSFILSNPSFEARSAVLNRYWNRLWGDG